MKIITFEGTPEEYQKIAHLLTDISSDAEETLDPVEPKEAIIKMLKRIPISDGQMAVYKSLQRERVEYQEFLNRTGRTSGAMAGVMGALGRRISNTPEIKAAGLPENTNAMFNWESEDEAWYLSLQPHAVDALLEIGIIR